LVSRPLKILFLIYAAFTLNDFDSQARSRSFAKTHFPVLELKFHICSIKKVFYPLYKSNIKRALQPENTFIEVFVSVSACQTCMRVNAALEMTNTFLDQIYRRAKNAIY